MSFYDLLKAKYGIPPGSHKFPAALFDLYIEGHLRERGDLADALHWAWSGSHLPFNALGYGQWVQFFEIAGYSRDGKLCTAPTDPMTLYRAAEPRFVHRLGWTASYEVAEKFIEINKRYGARPRHIYEITVPAGRLLGHFTDRGEDEYIADTRGLRSRRIWTAGEQS